MICFRTSHLGLFFAAAFFFNALALTNKAALDPRVGPNVRLGDDPSELPSDRRAQAEPHIVRSPVDPLLLVATFQEGRFEDGGAVNNGYAVSRDGGLTWSRALIPHIIQKLDGGAFDRASDPVAAIGLDGSILLNTLGVLGDEPERTTSVLLSVSTNLGASFLPPLRVADSQPPADFLDKNWMAVNPFPNTRTANRLAVAFTFPTVTNTPFGALTRPIVCTFSDDLGQTWAPLRFINSSVCIGAQPVFLPDGSLAVVFWNFLNPEARGRDNRIEIAFSPDGGETFESPRLAARVNVHDDFIARDGANLPSLAASHQTRALYLAFQGRDLITPRIFFTRSLDRGQTWSEPRVVSDTPLNRSVFNPAIAVSPDGQHVSIIFYDKRHDNGAGNFVDLYLAESFDGGETWEPNLRLSETSSDLRLAPLTDLGRMLGDYQGLAAAVDFDTPAVACWIDTRTGSPDPFTVRIQRARGTSFETWRRLRFEAGELAASGLSGAAADPDSDGLPNLAEYAFGTEPDVRNVAPVRTQIIRQATESNVVLSYERLRVLGDVTFEWHASTDLMRWMAIEPASEKVTKHVNPLLETVEAKFPLSDSFRFFRLVVAVKQIPLRP